jgi:outer membrane protein assembly factor BamC
MKRLAGLSALALIISSTAGCGWLGGDKGYFRDRGSDYLSERRTAPMQVPEGVNAKRLDPLLPIPERVSDAVASQEKYEVPRPQRLQVQANDSAFSLQQSGGSRWVVAQRNPAEVWPLVRQFLEDNYFQIAEERPQTGEFVTAWQRPDSLARALAKPLADVDGETRVRVRIEPGVQRNTSEVFLVSASRPADSSADAPWNTAGNARDGALLGALQASLESSGENGSVSLLAARDYDAPERVSLTADGSGNPVLNLDSDLERAWSSVGRALEQGDVLVDDRNRSLGLYYINLAESAQQAEEKPGFFSRLVGSGPDKSAVEARAERYQVRLSEVGNSVQISVEKDLNTVAPADVAKRILSLIRDNLG